MQEPGQSSVPGAADHRPRVLILIKELGLGGAERLVADVLANRDGEHFHYEVAYVLQGHDTLAAPIEATGVAVHCLGSTSSTDLRWMGRLRRLLMAQPFDVLHSHLPYTAALGRLVAASIPRRRRPVLAYTEHSLWNKAGVVSKTLNRATVHLDDALFVVSAASRDALPNALQSRAQVVVHGVDRSRTTSLVARRDEIQRQLRAELDVADDELVVLTVANLRTEKGYDTLLEAARLAVGRGVKAHFVSVGWGPLADTLAEQRDRFGLAQQFTFLGRRDDSLRIMTGSDVFVLPSHQEGLPIALMEAMSVGLPIVASAIGGVPDIVTDRIEGLLVPPGQATELADAIVVVTEDAALRARLAAAALARGQGLDVAVAARTIEDSYRTLLKARRRR